MPLEFEDQNGVLVRNSESVKEMSASTSFLIRHHLAQNEIDANKKMLVLAFLLIIISVTFLFIYLRQSTAQKTVQYNFSSSILENLPENTQIEILK